MSKHIALFAMLLFLGVSLNANATWLPENMIKADVPNPGPSNMDETEFEAIIAQLQNIYAPLVSSQGGKLSISGSWSDEKLNAGARQMFGSWQVVITGGLARRSELTPDGFTLILCHEIGHHMGGFAFAAPMPVIGTWAAVEGQSDYFSTQVCARKIWGNDTDKNAGFRQTVSAAAKQQCDQAWPAEREQNLCYRTLTAVESMITTMAVLTKSEMPKFETPDQKAVTKTDERHPAVQCRMDTALQGALCKSAFNDSLIPGKKVSGGTESVAAEREAAMQSCTAASGYNSGIRPTCWFKPRM